MKILEKYNRDELREMLFQKLEERTKRQGAYSFFDSLYWELYTQAADVSSSAFKAYEELPQDFVGELLEELVKKHRAEKMPVLTEDDELIYVYRTTPKAIFPELQ